MAITQTEIDAMKAALASGAVEVRHADGRGVKYNTARDLITAIEFAERQLAAASAATPPARMSRVVHVRT
jgi:hypothetical protein